MNYQSNQACSRDYTATEVSVKSDSLSVCLDRIVGRLMASEGQLRAIGDRLEGTVMELAQPSGPPAPIEPSHVVFKARKVDGMLDAIGHLIDRLDRNI